MRKLRKIGVFLLVVVISFAGGICTEKIMNSFYPHQKKVEEIYVKNEITEITETTRTALQSEEIVTADTKLIIIEHNLHTGEEVKGEDIIPTKYIGMNRERFVDEMKIYENSPALTDVKKGFKSLSVVSFSGKEIVLQKNYSGNEGTTHFFMVSKDNMLVIYYEDMETVFLATDISLETLPENVKREILSKKYFQNEEELYNFLESYSS